MLIWGSVGLFAKMIPMESAQIVLGRVVLGGIVLGIVYALSREKSSRTLLKKNIPVLALSGAAMGFNWIALFEGVQVYHGQLVHHRILLRTYRGHGGFSVLFKGEDYKDEGPWNSGGYGRTLVHHWRPRRRQRSEEGFLFGLLAAVLYASVTLLNKKPAASQEWKSP